MAIDTALMQNIYCDKTYLHLNPTWHEEDSSWKADQVLRMLDRHQLAPSSIADIGCGAGAILARLHHALPGAEYHGFDIAPPAIALAKQQQSPHLQFHAEDLLQRDDVFDLLLVIDVVEHVPDYLQFLAGCREKARHKIYHIPLDIHVSSVLRASFVRGRKTIGHIHYFTAESAFDALKDTGHTIIDWFYTNGAVELARLRPSLKRTLANVPRRVIGSMSRAWAARLLGGYSLLVLAE